MPKLPSDNYNVTVVNVNKCEVKVKIIMFAAGEPLTVTRIIKVSQRAVTNSLTAPDGERGGEKTSSREVTCLPAKCPDWRLA
jgi:hypothetical protein